MNSKSEAGARAAPHAAAESFAAADRLPVICWRADPEGRYAAVNRRWFDYGGEEDAANREALAAAIRSASASASATFRTTIGLRGEDGVSRAFLAAGRRAPGADGAWFGTCTPLPRHEADERSHAFLLRLGDAIRDESDPETILAMASEAIGRELGADRIVYATVNWKAGLLHARRDWRANGLPVSAHRFPMADYSDEYIETYSRGDPVSSVDVERDALVPGAMRRRCLDAGIRAFMSVPLVKSGTLTAFMAAQHFAPRAWRETELRLLEEVAERTWASLERAEANAALRESEQMFRTVTEAHPVPVVIAQESGLLLANPAFYEMMSVEVGDAAALDPGNWLDGRRGWSEFVAFVRAHRRYDDHQNWLLRGGRRFPVAISWRHIAYKGEPAVICSFVDLTDRRRAEEELATSREKLHQAEKMTALGGLLAGVSHELNNPLTIVTAQASLLEELADGSPMAARAQKVRLAAERCSRIVQTFLAMARQKEPERRRVDAGDLVRAALALNDYSLRTAGVEVALDVAPGLPPLHADPDQLHQVLVNLIVNAQQALQQKEGKRNLRVRVAAADGGARVAIDVADDGPGVPPEIRRRVFEPFFTTKPEGVGTGVGLSFSLGLVEAHGGTLELIDAPGGGACFRVTLDAAGDAPGASAEAAAEAGRGEGRGRALIVDDEADVAEVLAAIASRAGYEVETAGNGREAIERLGARDYDVILSDLRMPEMDGPALFEWIGREKPHLAARIGFVTGDTLGDMAARFIERSGRPVLEKPFSGKNVRALLERLAGGEGMS